jgi:hypothetical protein
MSDVTTPEEYIKTLPDRLMALAHKNATLKISIKSHYVPLIAADLMRGLLSRVNELPEDNLPTQLMNMSQKQPNVHIKLNAQSAKMMATDLRNGAKIREKQH